MMCEYCGGQCDAKGFCMRSCKGSLAAMERARGQMNMQLDDPRYAAYWAQAMHREPTEAEKLATALNSQNAYMPPSIREPEKAKTLWQRLKAALQSK